LRRWTRQEEIHCYRLYDADLPEFAVAIDRYEQWVHVQEYAPPLTVDPAMASRRLRQILSVIPQVLAVSPEDVFLKVRRKKSQAGQYQKLQQSGTFYEVQEGGHRFLVNFTDYLDTGLFLDHRLTRALIQDHAPGRRFLNLFAYTGTASVYAAKGGANATTTVDLSAPYLEWTRKNLALNGLSGPAHQVIRADCLEWVQHCSQRFDLIFLDPPTFSNSKAMRKDFDVQRDHVELLQVVARLLAPGGELIFSNNFQRFKLDESSLSEFEVENLQQKTLPKDFSRNPRIHHAWLIRRHA
jgi:23S rRNA (guanine2445-N2)-methyltransferase / 23S rRNA (guanine2069-N7)-methyltransferase